MHIDMWNGIENLYQANWLSNHVLQKRNGGYIGIELILVCNIDDHISIDT